MVGDESGVFGLTDHVDCEEIGNEAFSRSWLLVID
jgi:hypothetical protein